MGMTKGYPLGSLLIFTCYFPFCLPLPLISHSRYFFHCQHGREKMWLLAHLGGYCTYQNFEQVPISVHSAGVHTERGSTARTVSWSEMTGIQLNLKLLFRMHLKRICFTDNQNLNQNQISESQQNEVVSISPGTES